jgi:hypothetical protein
MSGKEKGDHGECAALSLLRDHGFSNAVLLPVNTAGADIIDVAGRLIVQVKCGMHNIPDGGVAFKLASAADDLQAARFKHLIISDGRVSNRTIRDAVKLGRDFRFITFEDAHRLMAGESVWKNIKPSKEDRSLFNALPDDPWPLLDADPFGRVAIDFEKWPRYMKDFFQRLSKSHDISFRIKFAANLSWDVVSMCCHFDNELPRDARAIINRKPGQKSPGISCYTYIPTVFLREFELLSGGRFKFGEKRYGHTLSEASPGLFSINSQAIFLGLRRKGYINGHLSCSEEDDASEPLFENDLTA